MRWYFKPFARLAFVSGFGVPCNVLKIECGRGGKVMFVRIKEDAV